MPRPAAEIPTKGGEPSASETKANEEALRRMKDDVEKEEREGASKDDDVRVRLDEPDDTPEREDPEDEPEPPRASRTERRANRYTDMRNEAQAAREEAASLKGRLEAMEQYMRQASQPAPAATPERPDEITQMLAEKERLQSEYALALQAGQITTELYKRYQERYEAIDGRIADARIERRIATERVSIKQQMEQEALRTAHADVYENPAAVQWARGYYHQQLAKRRPDGRALYEESMEQARAEFKISGRGAPTRETRARFTSSATGGGGAAAGSGGGAEIVMDKRMRQMANAAYSHIKNESERYQKWANEVGRDLGK